MTDTWLPWREAELELPDGSRQYVKIRFLNTRTEEDEAAELVTFSTRHLQLHGDGGERETHRRLMDRHPDRHGRPPARRP